MEGLLGGERKAEGKRGYGWFVQEQQGQWSLDGNAHQAPDANSVLACSDCCLSGLACFWEGGKRVVSSLFHLSSENQITVSECTAKRNTVCGCRDKEYLSGPSCRKCSSCPNGTIVQQCE